MRRAAPPLAMLALVLAACASGGGAALPSAAPATTSVPSASEPPAMPTTQPSIPQSQLPDATAFTPDDEAIAKVVTAAVDEALPQLKVLNDTDPSKLEKLFVPLGDWIMSQRTAVESLTPSACTAVGVELFEDGLDQYDAIRKKFLAWRDWGANGNAFPPGAPREAAATLEEAVTQLEAHCSS